MTATRREIGDLLVDNGVITPEELARVRFEREKTGQPFPHILSRLGLAGENQLKNALELEYGVNFIALRKVEPDTQLVNMLPEPIIREHLAVPIARDGGRITVAMVDPGNAASLDALKKQLNGASLKTVVCLEDDFEEFVNSALKPAVIEAPQAESNDHKTNGDQSSESAPAPRVEPQAPAAVVAPLPVPVSQPEPPPAVIAPPPVPRELPPAQSAVATENSAPPPPQGPTPHSVPPAQSTAAPPAQPTATPPAQPTATHPTPAPAAQPTATPPAQPTATPAAQPTATPAAQPTATPAAQPTATPAAQSTATPAAQPTATPPAQPTATPPAQPAATPSASAPAPAPAGQPSPLPVSMDNAQPPQPSHSAEAIAASVPGLKPPPPVVPGPGTAPEQQSISAAESAAAAKAKESKASSTGSFPILDTQAAGQERASEPDGDGENLSEHALARKAQEEAIVLLANQILGGAIKRHCSNIHISAGDKQAIVQYRLNGVLYVDRKLPKTILTALIARYKMMARMNLAERDLPQDGHIKVKSASKEIVCLVSTIPSEQGENVVIWIL